MCWKQPVICTLAAALPALAAAQPMGSPGGWGHRPGFDPEKMEERLDERADQLARALDLTAEQQAAFDRLRKEGFEAARPRIETARRLGDELRQMIESDRPDAATVGAKVIELHRLREELRKARESAETEIEKLLTPEQRFAFRALRELRDDGPDGPRFGRRPGGPFRSDFD
jgi:Spy/CpxP family protein refolding chaperone